MQINGSLSSAAPLWGVTHKKRMKRGDKKPSFLIVLKIAQNASHLLWFPPNAELRRRRSRVALTLLLSWICSSVCPVAHLRTQSGFAWLAVCRTLWVMEAAVSHLCDCDGPDEPRNDKTEPSLWPWCWCFLPRTELMWAKMKISLF